MDFREKQKLANLGGVIALYGLASSILSFVEFNLVVLLWIEFWGETVAWIIRVGLIVTGLVIYFKMEVDDKDLFPEDKELE